MSFYLNLLESECTLTSIVTQDEQIKAKMENGVLTVTFPKCLDEHAPKRIVVSDV